MNNNINLVTRRFCALLFVFSFTCVACEQTVRVSVAKNWPPYSYQENGAVKGLDVEIVNIILMSAGLCWETYQYPSSSRAFAEFRKDKVDLIFAASLTNERKDYAVFSQPYRREDMMLFSHIEKQQPISLGPDTLIAINRGSFYGDNFESFKRRCPECIVTTNQSNERMELIKRKRVDYAIEDAMAGAHLILTDGYSDDVKPTRTLVNSNPVHLMLNERTLGAEVITRINHAITANEQGIIELVQAYKQHLKLEQFATVSP